MDLKILPCKKISGEIQVQGDKSISHRAIMLSSLSDGICKIYNLLEADDCLRTVECFRIMGISIQKSEENSYLVCGRGLNGLTSPSDILYVGNSGTLIRLLLGILAGQNFTATITGDSSIKQRPMKRVVEPLRKMGAIIKGKNDGEYAPLEIKGGKLRAIDYTLPVASAQIKSSLMFAALFADGTTKITEPMQSRDHTERMFKFFEIPFLKSGNTISVSAIKSIKPHDVIIPGDISSAAFFIVAALIVPESKICIKNVGLNPTRTGIIDVLLKMGADVKIDNLKEVCGEPVGDIVVKYSKLKGTSIGGDIIPRIIDELPIIAVAAAFADGDTIVSDAQELKVKESNRIKTIVEELKKLNVKAVEKDDGFIITGGNKLKGTVCQSYGDHRIAMSLTIAALAAEGETTILDCDCISTSFPLFTEILKNVAEY